MEISARPFVPAARCASAFRVGDLDVSIVFSFNELSAVAISNARLADY